MTETTTPTETYWVESTDGDVLWRGQGRDASRAWAVTARSAVDRIDPILWPTLVAALIPPAEDDDLRALVHDVCEREGVSRAVAMYRLRTERPATTVDIPTARAAVERICADLLATAIDTV